MAYKHRLFFRNSDVVVNIERLLSLKFDELQLFIAYC